MKLVIDHLEKHFEKKEVLRDLSFTFESGRIYGLLGRNGAGKTTFFNCLNRDLKADGGRFFLEDETGEREMKPEDIGYVLSTPTVPEFLTGREFLKFFTDINEGSIREKKSLDEYFDYMSIDREDRDKLMKDYSHGMKNKMQMLVNIIANPRVLLLDEPLTSLDVVVAEEMKELLRSLKAGRITIFSTHILELAADLCDDIVLLNHGLLEEVDAALIHTPQFEERVVELLCVNPAKCFNIFPQKGTISAGADGDLVIVDMNHEHVFHAKDSYSQARDTMKVFEGWELGCTVDYTVVRGRVIVDNGVVDESAAGWGKYVTPNKKG